MGATPSIKILYRIAESANKNPKNKPEWINNQNCLQNIFNNKKEETELIVFGDRLKESEIFVKANSNKYIKTIAHGNSETFLEVLQYAMDNFDKDDIVYFVEDDYVHKKGFEDYLIDGLNNAHYVSLYDHPDKYKRQNFVFVTELSHWQLVESTTMTFATNIEQLSYDKVWFQKVITSGNPPDHYLWSFMTQQQFTKLATPIKGQATHGETVLMSPLVDWEAILKSSISQ